MNFSHPAFAPYQPLINALYPQQSIDSLNLLAAKRDIRHDNGCVLRFEAGDMPDSAADYELNIGKHACIPTRENNLHDFLNALVWLRFPKLKSAVNQKHCQVLSDPDERKQRGKLRDQLTLLDESGVLVASPRQDLLNLLQEKHWLDLFWQARDDVVKRMTFIVVGHGLLEKCMHPFASMTGKCLLMETGETRAEKLDSIAARRVRDASVLTLPPLPIQGIPDWDNNDLIGYYQNTRIFRPQRFYTGLMPQTHS